jgi:hypothetical protein
MTEKKVRGLLDVIGLEDGEWELEMPSADYVPGMGLGATQEAIDLAKRGYRAKLEEFSALNKPRAKRGRPPKADKIKKPQLLAMHIWLEIRDMPRDFRRLSNRELIGWMQSRFKKASPETTVERIWSNEISNIEALVSTGRKYWELDNEWNSPKLEAWLKAKTDN